MTDTVAALPDGYPDFLAGLKTRVRDAQIRAQRVVNTQLIELYWNLGNEILAQQETQAWGSGVIRRLGEDLRAEFPRLTGLSYRNLQYMRSFASAWSGEPIVQQAVAQLPWGHITVLLDKLDDPMTRDWYAAAAVEHGSPYGRPSRSKSGLDCALLRTSNSLPWSSGLRCSTQKS
jgi:predicted nuclease of restriction endonuclease-like (RecB) superfamily